MIYFLRSPSSGLIKIGRTRFLRVRLADLSYQHREPLIVLGVLDEPDVYETQLHRQFKRWRVVGEWFEPTAHLLRFVTAHARAWTPEDDAEPGNEVAVKIDRAVWHYCRAAARDAGVPVNELITGLLRQACPGQRATDDQ